MNCESLMHMKKLRDGIRLVSGKKGLDHPIRWIYFADCSQCLSDEVNLADLIHGEELVIVTNTSLTDDDNKIMDMIRTMQKKHIAGFVINEGQISERIRKYCDEINLPLFELSLSLHLIDLSQEVCRALIEEESLANSRERVLSSILYSEYVDAEELREQADYLGISLGEQARVVVLKVFQPELLPDQTRSIDEPKRMDMRERIKKEIKWEFRAHGLEKLLLLVQEDMAVVLLQADLFSRDLLTDILEHIIEKTEHQYKVKMRAGIGTAYDYMEDYRKSYQEAKSALQISRIARMEERVFFYENLGIYALLSQISNEKFLDDYVENCIGKLIKADQLQEGELCATLEAYLDHNCNANATAEALFIHRNTMRYRMDKIKKILNNDISDMSVYLELKMAFAIRRYREKSEAE